MRLDAKTAATFSICNPTKKVKEKITFISGIFFGRVIYLYQSQSFSRKERRGMIFL